MMKLLLIAALAVTCSSLPQEYEYDSADEGSGHENSGYGGPVIPILVDNREGSSDGHYAFDFETGNGIIRKEMGVPSAGKYGSVVQKGEWSFTFPDGTPAVFSFVANERGYRVESPLLPVPPPIPHYSQLQIEKAEMERAQGITHDHPYYENETETEPPYTEVLDNEESQHISETQSVPSRLYYKNAAMKRAQGIDHDGPYSDDKNQHYEEFVKNEPQHLSESQSVPNRIYYKNAENEEAQGITHDDENQHYKEILKQESHRISETQSVPSRLFNKNAAIKRAQNSS